MSKRKIKWQKEEEKWSRELFRFIIADNISGQQIEYPDPKWVDRFLQLEADGEYKDNDNYEDYEDCESKEDKLGNETNL